MKEYERFLVENPRDKKIKNSFMDGDLPVRFRISEGRMNEIMARKGMAKEIEMEDEEEEEPQDQNQLLQSLLSNLRDGSEEENDEFNHDYLSDDSDEDNFPVIEYDFKQYGSVKSDRILKAIEPVSYHDQGYWNTTKVDYDVDELLEHL